MNTPPTTDPNPPLSGHAQAMLFVLFLVSILNFLDRQLITILLGQIKAQFHATDAQLGFLFGTVFAAFYTVFGIPLGLYADLGSRKKLLAWGLGVWSLMTGLCGFASSFPMLALARMGVGVGEATAAPSAYSLISDLFPKERRGAALGVYSFGIYIGIGLSTLVGGLVVDRWDRSFAPGTAPLDLAGWQAAFVLAAIPGLLLVPFVLLCREPARATLASDPARRALREGLALLPPTSFFFLRRDGGAVAPNVAVFIGLCGVVLGLTSLFGDPAQWVCVAIGLYVVTTMAQRLKVTEPETHALLFNTPSLRWATLGFSFLSINGYAMGTYMPQYFVRYHGLSSAYIGVMWGLISAICGGLGVVTGGLLADRFKRTHAPGRLFVGMMNALLPLPFLIPALSVGDADTALILIAGAQFFAAMWLGAGSSTVQDLVLPRMRARASAVFLLFVNLISLALGPYLVGKLSDHWHSLRDALMTAAGANLVAFVLFLVAARTLGSDEATREERAAAARA